MKKILFLILAALSFTACQKAKSDASISFNIPYSQTTALPGVPGYADDVTIPAGGTSMPFAPVKVFINAQQYFDQYRTSAENIESTNLGSMNVQITTPGNHYFDFMDAMELYISSESQPEIMIAADYNIPYGTKSINLTVMPGLNLKNYIVGDSITVRLNAYVNAVPLPGAQLLLTGNFQIIAHPL